MWNTGISWSSAAWTTAPVQMFTRDAGAITSSTAMGWPRRHSSGSEKQTLIRSTSGSGAVTSSRATVRHPPEV